MATGSPENNILPFHPQPEAKDCREESFHGKTRERSPVVWGKPESVKGRTVKKESGIGIGLMGVRGPYRELMKRRPRTPPLLL